jgi:alkanesulfonate monooxygenase SsuD/methylene tetrahydromethanopterin reductase-like flavin-dependent oxidoreductase (luciferase family)
MHVALVMECDYREGRTQEEAFAEAMSIAEIAETQGLDSVWLAERHFAIHRRPLDPMGAGIPSIASVPLVLAAAIAARTTRLRIGTGVSVLPLCHPIRTAEEAATVDQISLGRLDFGVGRSGFPRAYSGYGVRYARAASASRNRSTSFSRPGRRKVSRTRGNISRSTISAPVFRWARADRIR